MENLPNLHFLGKDETKYSCTKEFVICKKSFQLNIWYFFHLKIKGLYKLHLLVIELGTLDLFSSCLFIKLDLKFSVKRSSGINAYGTGRSKEGDSFSEEPCQHERGSHGQTSIHPSRNTWEQNKKKKITGWMSGMLPKVRIHVVYQSYENRTDMEFI